MDDAIVRRRFDWMETTPSFAIVSAIAAIENVDPTDLPQVLGTPLYTYVDPEALDTLVTDDRHVALEVAVGDYRIRIDGDELRITDG